MRLSEAIMLGATRYKLRSCGWWYDHEESGCALGIAARACGVKFPFRGAISTLWPWLNKPYSQDDSMMSHIFTRFDDEVIRGRTMTIEQLADYVRSIEPSEPESTNNEISTTISDGSTVGCLS